MLLVETRRSIIKICCVGAPSPSCLRLPWHLPACLAAAWLICVHQIFVCVCACVAAAGWHGRAIGALIFETQKQFRSRVVSAWPKALPMHCKSRSDVSRVEVKVQRPNFDVSQ